MKGRSYMVKDIFLTVQGEGALAGTPAVFVRFAGCNFWTGRAEDRATSACPFCDTDFAGGERLSASEIVSRVMAASTSTTSMIVFTGGEPLLQLDAPLAAALAVEGFRFLAVETNGSVAIDDELEPLLDWICCSPKDKSKIRLKRCSELKVLYPTFNPLAFLPAFAGCRMELFVQPTAYGPHDSPASRASLQSCLDFVHRNRGWRLSLQTHKLIGVP